MRVNKTVFYRFCKKKQQTNKQNNTNKQTEKILYFVHSIPHAIVDKNFELAAWD